MRCIERKIGGLKIEEVKTGATYEILCDLFDQSLFPLFQKVFEKLRDFNDLFLSHNYFWQIESNAITDINELENFGKMKIISEKIIRFFLLPARWF